MSRERTHLFNNLSHSLEKLATYFLFQGRFDAAHQILNEHTLHLYHSEGELEGWVRLQNLRARILRFQGYCQHSPALYDEALDVLTEPLPVAESLEDKALLADTLDLVGFPAKLE